jgi:hypothetical protein
VFCSGRPFGKVKSGRGCPKANKETAMKMWTTAVMLSLFSITAAAQDTVRQIDGSGQFTKYLTPGLLDSWVIEGEKGETIIAHVSTKEFDPILELATKFDGQDKVLFAVDDEGSEARFAFRLPEKGEYKIQIHAFKYKGGGNYSLRIRRFQATPLVVGTRLIGTIDQTGKRHHYFQGKEDQILIPELKGASSRSWEMIDVKGRQMSHWSGTVRIENDGVHSLVVSGGAGNRYEILIRESHQRTLDEGKKLNVGLDQREMDVWSFEGEPGEFRLLEVNTKGQLLSRLIYAPRKKKDLQRITRARSRPEIQFMPVGSKGGRLRIAAVLGRRGRYQLHPSWRRLLRPTTCTWEIPPSLSITGKNSMEAFPLAVPPFTASRRCRVSFFRPASCPIDLIRFFVSTTPAVIWFNKTTMVTEAWAVALPTW